jgi:hypothetical protein
MSPSADGLMAKTQRKKRKKASNGKATTSRRVALQRHPSRNAFGTLSADAFREGATATTWEEGWIRESLGGSKIHPVARLTDEGVDYGQVPQAGGDVAYAMDPYRLDDCLQGGRETLQQAAIGCQLMLADQIAVDVQEKCANRRRWWTS